ncbi:MAG: S8 family peptidase, partial [Candidatus Aenigmatarchaeota archaeon]
MIKGVFAGLLMAFMLLAPCFAAGYIITPTSNENAGIIGISSAETHPVIEEGRLRPIYGSNTYSAELSGEEIESLKDMGYIIQPDYPITTFLDESVPQINADDLWSVQIGGQNINGTGQAVCIIDTGIDYNHSAFGGGWGTVVVAGYNFIDGDNAECNSTNPAPCYDDNGHGTQVAGVIASRNTTYRGVAPGAKIIIVKTLDNSGSGYLSDLVSGLNYCTDAAAEYNISVISLSLGTADYRNSTYCDGFSQALTTAINNAVANNISVVAAAGNSGDTSAIAAPACIRNATPVSSVKSTDEISYFSNYWSLPLLFAPGEGINTPKIGSWGTMTGTSIAAPHAAGAYALIGQYLALTGNSKTPEELETLFIGTGADMDSNENHKRIDPYLTYLNYTTASGNFSFSVNQTGLEYSLNPGADEILSLLVTASEPSNITLSFGDLSGAAGTIPAAQIFFWDAANSSNNASGTGVLTIEDTDNATIQARLSAPINASGVYGGSAVLNITRGTNTTTVPLSVRADALYQNWKKIEYAGSGTINCRVEVGDIRSLAIRGNFSNATDSIIIVKNESGSVVENISRRNVTQNTLQIVSLPSGIFEITLGCGRGSEGVIVNQSLEAMQEEIAASWVLSVSSLETESSEINLTLEAGSEASGSFNLTTNITEENISLAVESFYQEYSFYGNATNHSAQNFTFILPVSAGFSANLIWMNSSETLSLNLTNTADPGQSYLNATGSGAQTLALNSSQASYGIWTATVSGDNVSADNQTFALILRIPISSLAVNFTEISHVFEDKALANGSAENWTIYVDNTAATQINLTLALSSPANTTQIKLFYPNATEAASNNTGLLTGEAQIIQSALPKAGYWTVSVINQNETANITYNLAATLSGNNLT